MNPLIADHVENCLHHLYISPLEQCNLCCQMCYTAKSSGRLTNDQILDFIHRYQQVVSLQSITFCGGEVFLLPDFTSLINQLTQKDFFVQIITNGTIDKLSEITHPNQVNVIVSLDGLPDYHNQNRGPDRWQQSIDFLTKALTLGFHGEVFSIVTKENMRYINEFEEILKKITGQQIQVTYHPRKPMTYLQSHPISNRLGTTVGFSFLSSPEKHELERGKIVFPPPNLGCYQIAVMSDGQVYGCCEGIRPLGSLSTPVKELITAFRARLTHWCHQYPKDTTLGCVEPDFVCGLRSVSSEKQCH